LSPFQHRLVLLLIVAAYLFLGALYATLTPPWQNPDEPAHYHYIGHLVETGRLPVLEPGDYDQTLLDRLLAQGFPVDEPLQRLAYQGHQPPLYYLLAAPVHATSGGSLVVLRLATLLLGLGIVLIAHAVTRRLFPDQPLIALGSAAFVAFLPQHTAMMAAVNNDALAGLMAAALLLMSLRLIQVQQPGRATLLSSGIILGLGLITKATVYPAAGVLLFALACRWRHQGGGNWASQSRQLVLVLAPALLLAGPWWLRNALVYGWPDVLGLIRHAEVAIGQPRTSDWIAEHGLVAWLVRGIQFTFQSFWGQFGWMGVVMDSRVYLALALTTVLAVVGCLLPCPTRFRPADHRAALVLVLQFLLALAAFAAFNASFVQHQGRYLFTAVIPVALLFAVGWFRLLHACGLQQRSRAIACTALCLGLFTINLHAIFQRIVPLLGPASQGGA
jgi:4-amino-4-deoxy-L-arabinose transferase-like glycosyltransferase